MVHPPARIGAPIASRVASPIAEAVAAKRREGEPAARTGLPPRLRTGIEALSGLAMDDVRVHRNSAEPAKLGALAFTKGGEIHLGPGQEQHLPHEAWHVVQQKQGRVKATAQMKSVAVSDDAGLEREADRMGAVATRHTLRPAGGLANRAPSGAVIQAKVKAGNTLLSGTAKASATLRAYIAKSETYLLREDFHAKLMDEPVHLMDMSKKFLLGEQHGAAATAKWKDATKFWSKVSKMFEWNKALPRADRADVGMPAETDLQDLSLESRHAYLLLNVLRAINEINALGASWVKSLWKDPKNKALIVSTFAEAEDQLGAADFSHGEYFEFIKSYQKKKNTSARSLKIYYFAVRFHDSYHAEIGKLNALLASAREAVDKYDPSKRDEAAKLSAVVSASLPKIGTDHAFLRQMARELIEINAVTDKTELKTFSALLAPANKGQGTEMILAADPARERAMAANITSAAPPLLVKVGDGHVDHLKDLVGAAAVPIHLRESLEKETKRP